MNIGDNKKWLKYELGLLSATLFIVTSILFVSYIGPERIISFVGIDNSYILIFVVAIFGGFTTFNAIPYHPLLITFALGGLNPYLLGILAAVGVSLGDSTSYLLGYFGRTILPDKVNKWFDPIRKLGIEKPNTFMLVSFLYACFIPASNDFITIPAGIARLKFWRVMLPLVFGNIVFDVSLALLAPNVAGLIQKFF